MRSLLSALIAMLGLLAQVHSIPSQSIRQDGYPYFPATPESCQKCAVVYPNISSCCAAAYLFQNFSDIIFDPSGFTDVIGCSCTDTFQAAFPQCVDCFIQTNQTAFLNATGTQLPGIVSGMRQVCAFASTLFGGVASADGQVPSSSVAAPTPTATASGSSPRYGLPLLLRLDGPLAFSELQPILLTSLLLLGAASLL